MPQTWLPPGFLVQPGMPLYEQAVTWILVLFTSPLSLDDLAVLRAALQQATQVDDIDLVSLNQASSILRFEAVSGRLIIKRDTAQLVEFVSLTAREYEFDLALLQSGLHQRQVLRHHSGVHEIV